MNNCVHWGKGSATRFEGGFMVTDFQCRKCGAEYQVRAKYLPWNTPAANESERAARHARLTSKQYTMGE